MRILLLLLIAIMVHLAPAKAADEDWNKVVAAAKKEGKVVVYSAAPPAPAILEIVKSFEKKYAIKVETLDLGAGDLTERIRSEQAAGRFLGDIEESATAAIEHQIHAGLTVVQPPGFVPNVKNLREPFVAASFSVPAWAEAFGFFVSTEAVSELQMPKTWVDLLNDKWKGRILADDPRGAGAGATMFAATTLAYGVDFEKKLAAQQLVFGHDPATDARRVARGEYPVYIPQMFALSSAMTGLPVVTLVPSDGAPYVTISNAVLKRAPHSNAARVFINHFLALDSQIALANGWMQPVVKGAADGANAQAKPYAAAKLMGAVPGDKADEMAKLAKEIYQ